MAFLTIGKLGKTHGLKGELRVSFEAFFYEFLDQLEAVYIEMNGSTIPYFIEELNLRNESMHLLKFEDVSIKEQAIPFHQKEMLVQVDEYPGLKEALLEQQNYNMLIGFQLFLGQKELAKIQEVFYLPHQSMARIEIDKQEVLLPLHPDLIEEINFEEEWIRLDLDEDYLSVYFEETEKDS